MLRNSRKGTDWLARGPILALALTIPPLTTATDGVAQTDRASDTHRVALEYLEHLRANTLDAGRAVMADDLYFIDLTTDQYGPNPMAEGIVGADELITVLKTFRTDPYEWFGGGPRVQWFSREWAFTFGLIDLGDERPGVPFATLLHVRDGKVDQRHDYGDYAFVTHSIDEGEADEHTRMVTETADRYFDAYAAGDLQRLEALMVPDIAFDDPTADAFGAGLETLVRGREAVLGRIADRTSGIGGLSLEELGRFYSRNYAFRVHRARWVQTLSGAGASTVEVDVPVVTILRIADGRIETHRDIWNVEAFLAQVGDAELRSM